MNCEQEFWVVNKREEKDRTEKSKRNYLFQWRVKAILGARFVFRKGCSKTFIEESRKKEIEGKKTVLSYKEKKKEKEKGKALIGVERSRARKEGIDSVRPFMQ